MQVITPEFLKLQQKKKKSLVGSSQEKIVEAWHGQLNRPGQ